VAILKKVRTVLNRVFKPAFPPDLEEDDDGVIGVVVSDQFRGVEPVERQVMIYKALRTPAAGLSEDEVRRVLAIAPLTPEEYVAYAPTKNSRPAKT
jgi:acid stress-induced BolA-like protein IbaG/YrbA